MSTPEARGLDSATQADQVQGFNRRDFFKMLLAAGVLGASFREVLRGIDEDDGNDILKLADRVEMYDKLSQALSESQANVGRQMRDGLTQQEEQSYLKTLEISMLATSAKMITGFVLGQLGIQSGNRARIRDLLKDGNDIPSMVTGVVVAAPIIEEALFRLLPSLLADDDGRVRWDAGLPLAAIFALAHNFETPKGFKVIPRLNIEGVKEWLINVTKMRFASDSVPIQQFIGGLVYWYLMRTQGYDHAVLAHATNNSVALAIGAFLYATSESDIVPNDPDQD